MVTPSHSPTPERPTHELVQLGSTEVILPLLPVVASFLKPGWDLVGWLPECHLSHPRYVEFLFELTNRVSHLLRNKSAEERITDFVVKSTKNPKAADPVLGLLIEEFPRISRIFLPEEQKLLFFGGAKAFKAQLENGIELFNDEAFPNICIAELLLASSCHLLALRERQRENPLFIEHLLGSLANITEELNLAASTISARDLLTVRLAEFSSNGSALSAQTKFLVSEWNNLINNWKTTTNTFS